MGSVSNETVAKRIITAACKGQWLLIDNLQLALQIVPNLIKFTETMFAEEKVAKEKMKEVVESMMQDYKRDKATQGKRDLFESLNS